MKEEKERDQKGWNKVKRDEIKERRKTGGSKTKKEE